MGEDAPPAEDQLVEGEVEDVPPAEDDLIEESSEPKVSSCDDNISEGDLPELFKEPVTSRRGRPIITPRYLRDYTL